MINGQQETVLAIGAHPDDIEFMMAGTLFLLEQAGWNIHCMNLCDGSCGSVSEVASAVAARRAAEAKKACRLLGAELHGSLAPDLQLVHDTQTVSKVVSIVRRARPSILLLHSPVDYMEDHMNACRIGVTAAFARGMRNFPCEPPVDPIDTPVTVYHALPYGLRDPLRRRVRAGQYVDISSVIHRKRSMLACHESQKEWLDRSQGLDAYLDAMTEDARRIGELSGFFEFAEGWRRRLHLGFCGPRDDFLSDALGRKCVADDRYEADL